LRMACKKKQQMHMKIKISSVSALFLIENICMLKGRVWSLQAGHRRIDTPQSHCESCWLSCPMSALGLPKPSLSDWVFLTALPPAAGPNTHLPMPDWLNFIFFCERFLTPCRQLLFLLILLLFSF